MDLRKELEGVTQDSPPADQEPENKPEGESKGKEDGDGRSLDNVRGELLRKQEKLRDEIADLRADIRGLTQSMKPTSRQDAPADSLDAMSVAQVEALRSQVPEEKKSEYEAYLVDRKVRETIDARMSVFTEAQKTQQERQRFNQTAVSRYPDLMDLASDFAREVESRLREQPEEYVKNNPRIVLDVANDVAVERGIKPTARRVVRGRTAGGRTEPAPIEEKPVLLSDEERVSIAKRLEGALPKGKKFNMDNIKKREQFYSGDELNLRINRG